MKYIEQGVRVSASSHGLGVFALRSFSTGEIIGPIHGEVVEDPDYGSDYGMELGDQTLEPAAPFRFLNHCCQPNAGLVIYQEEDEAGAPDGLSIWLEILSDIAVGEQLTIDYSWPADAAIPCGCGSAACRGWIVAEEALDELLAAKADLVAVE